MLVCSTMLLLYGYKPNELVVKRLAIMGCASLVLANSIKESKVINSYAGKAAAYTTPLTAHLHQAQLLPLWRQHCLHLLGCPCLALLVQGGHAGGKKIQPASCVGQHQLSSARCMPCRSATVWRGEERA